MQKKLAAMFSIAALSATAVIGVATPASALSPGVEFNAIALPTWQTNGIAWTIAEAGGVMYVGGTFTQIRPPGTSAGSGQSRAAVNFAAFDAYTGNPTSCALSFTGGTGTTVRAMDVSPDGSKLYVGGNFSTVNGVPANRLAAISLPSCTVDTGFRPGSISSTVRAVAATADTVYIGGDFVTVNNQSRRFFAAVNTSGALQPWAPEVDTVGRAIDVPEGRDIVLIGGDFATVNGADSKALAVVDRGTGANVRTYPTREYIPRTAVIKDIASDGGNFYIAGEGTGPTSFDGRARLSLENNYEQVWKDVCLGATQAVLPYNGVLYAGHHIHDCGAMGGFSDGSRKHLSAQDIDNPYPFLGWSPDTNDGSGEGIGPRAMAMTQAASNNVLWVAGEFTTTNGSPQQGLTRFGPGPASAAPSTPATVSVSSLAAGQNTIRWRQSVDNDDSELSYSIYRNGSSTPLGTVAGSSRWFDAPQLSFTDTTARPGTAYTYRVRASDGTNNSALSAQVSVTTAAETQPYPEAVLRDGATTYWRLDDANAAAPADTSPFNNRGITFSAPQIAGTVGAVPGSTGAVFDGVDDQVSGQQRYPAPTTYTAEAWFKTSTTRGGEIFAFASGQPNRHGDRNATGTVDRSLYMTNDGKLSFAVLTGTNTWAAAGTQAPYNDDVWHHAAVSHTDAGWTMYIDGKVAANGQTPATQKYKGSWRVGGDSLTFRWPSRPASGYLAGSIDEFAAYPTALSAEQVVNHFVAGGGSTDPGTEPEPQPDTTAPSAVGGTAANVEGGTATLVWEAATDNVGVTGYQIHRSTADGFEPSETSLLATTGPSALSYTDTDLTPGTYYYRVLAVDEAGNQGPASAQAVATVAGPPPVEPVTLTLIPTADTYVNQGAPNSILGAAVSMASRGNMAYTSYLRFSAGTDVPPGMRLSSASLRLYTTSESMAGSVDQHTIHAVDGSWEETTTTYNSRPSLAEALLGSVAPTAINTPYTVQLDPAAVAAMLSGSIELGVTSVGSDNAWFYTKEASSTRRPVLTLVFE